MHQPLTVLAFFAHPDDETMLCGGTLALLAQAGARVHVLIATRGEGGEMGEPPLCTREELGKVREDELRCAVQALGAGSLTLLDYVDPIVGPEDALFAFTEDVDRLAGQLLEAIRQVGAGAVLAHGVNGEYGHPAHKLIHQATLRAMQRLNDEPGQTPPFFYTVQSRFEGHPYPRITNPDEPAHLIIDVETVRAQKLAAARCHRTQHALFIRHQSEAAGRPLVLEEVIQTLESAHRVWPPHDSPDPIHDPLADLLWASGVARQPSIP